MNGIEINWVLIVVIAVLLVYGIRGKNDGFIRTVFGMFSLMAALLTAAAIGPHLSSAIKESESVLPYITEKLEDNERKDHKQEPIQALSIPDVLKEFLELNNTSEKYEELAVDQVEEYIHKQVAIWMINALSFIIVFIITWVILWYLCMTLNIISKLPVLNGLNKTAGVLVGILRGFIVIWMWCIILTIFSGSVFGQAIFLNINSSPFLSLIYNNNLLLQIGNILM